jgi:hypothetical protein
MNLCKYKNIFGVPGKGIHAWKFHGTSLADYFLTIIAAFIITYFTKIPLVITTIVLFLLGIFFHYIFCLETQTVKFFT